MGSSRRRRSALAANRRKKPNQRESIYEQLQKALHSGTFIPIIGDAIRISHIFDVNLDGDMGVEDDDIEAYDEEEEKFFAQLTVTEQLAYSWAKYIEYPLADRHRMARVAQFCMLEEANAKLTKENYLAFLKDELLHIALSWAEANQDDAFAADVQDLYHEHTKSFTELVRDLDFPLFEDGREDPLRILARLPIKIFITTSAFNFIEQALDAENKKPRTQLCFWNLTPESVAEEYHYDPDYQPSVEEPVVYHLLGMEEYPNSIVLSEDDYLDFMWAVARDKPGDSGERIIPPYLEANLNTSSLLLLGYRLHDWDFRVLFRGLLNANRNAISRRGISVAIQIDPEEQPLVVKNKMKAKAYLNNYFKEAKFRVEWGDSDNFIDKLWETWQDRNAGGAS